MPVLVASGHVCPLRWLSWRCSLGLVNRVVCVRERGGVRWLLVVAVVGVVAGVAGWSARALLAPPAPLPRGAEYAVVEVVVGEIERGLNLNAAAAWSGGPSVVNAASGTVTEVRAGSGEPVESGSVLYTVDLSPVVIAAGSVPAFRLLALGARGADVRQLQELLAGEGQRVVVDGAFGAGTVRAVKAWQKSLGVTQTGEVALGSVVFVPTLPGVFAWADDVVVGAAVAPGMVVGRLLPAEPVFTMTLPPNQRTLVEPGMPVTIFTGEGQWRGRLGSVGEPDESGSAVAAIVPVEGAESVCGEQCAAIPPGGEGALRARITVIARQSGTVVPTAALAVGADGSSAVVEPDGSVIPVTVLASASGQALVDGVEEGTRVRVPADQAGSP